MTFRVLTSDLDSLLSFPAKAASLFFFYRQRQCHSLLFPLIKVIDEIFLQPLETLTSAHIRGKDRKNLKSFIEFGHVWSNAVLSF